MENYISNYQEYYLDRETERFVRKIWLVDNSENTESIIKSILPNGYLNIAIVKGQGAEVIINNQKYLID